MKAVLLTRLAELVGSQPGRPLLVLRSHRLCRVRFQRVMFKSGLKDPGTAQPSLGVVQRNIDVYSIYEQLSIEPPFICVIVKKSE